jgi:hypothetical protein
MISANRKLPQHEVQFTHYHMWSKTQDFAKEYLQTDSDGWIPPEEDIGEKRSQNQILLEHSIKEMASEKTEEEVKQLWPFLEPT